MRSVPTINRMRLIGVISVTCAPFSGVTAQARRPVTTEDNHLLKTLPGDCPEELDRYIEGKTSAIPPNHR